MLPTIQYVPYPHKKQLPIYHQLEIIEKTMVRLKKIKDIFESVFSQAT